MIDVIARIKTAATDEALRAAASAIWKRVSPVLFDKHDERDGLRVSDAGQCVRALWNEIHVAPKVFSPEIQLFNLDEGTLTGLWMACLLAASLGEDGYDVWLESEATHDGTPGHIDLDYERLSDGDKGVIEFKKTMWPRALTAPDARARYQVLQLMKYCAAKGIERGAIVTIGPASPDKMREDWYEIDDWRDAIIGEWMRLSAALGAVEPEGDPDAPWRCKGCPVLACPKNPGFVADGLLKKLEESYAARNG